MSDVLHSRQQILVLRVLSLGVALQCVGLWRTAYVDGTALGSTLFMTWGWSEDAMLAVELGAAWGVLALGAVTLLRPWCAGLMALAGWFALIAGLAWFQGGQFGYQYSVLAHATRIGAPLALAVLAWPGLDAERRREWGVRILRVAVALTFATHGLEALQHHPSFIDYIITAFRRAGLGISEPASRVLLTAIGVQDFVLAALVLTQRWRAVVGYMVLWGVVTALSRMVHMGTGKWPATLIRSANWAVPLALWVAWSGSREQASEHEEQGQKRHAVVG